MRLMVYLSETTRFTLPRVLHVSVPSFRWAPVFVRFLVQQHSAHYLLGVASPAHAVGYHSSSAPTLTGTQGVLN